VAERLNACELEIDLFCKGIRIDADCTLEDDARFLSRTRAGLGSGLELIIPGDLKDLWVNVPIEEDFAQDSPYVLTKEEGAYRVKDERSNLCYPVDIPPEPRWYSAKTSNGTPMSKVGVLQGTYLGIYVSNSCSFWYHSPSLGCKFCTTGLNVGVNEIADKDVQDVIDVAKAAKEESDVTFVHFNSGFGGKDRGLDTVAPFVKAIKQEVGLLTGVQVTPSPNLWKYDWLTDCGTDHFSFCYEFHNPRFFAELCPGKEKYLGQRTFFSALEYTAKKLGPGRVSGEIIAGVEPLEDTLKAIDYITGLGAFPTVCVFRPTLGAEMERYPSPSYSDMRLVMEYMWDACRKNNIPIGVAPNIEVSLVVTPDDARILPKRDLKWRAYEIMLRAGRRLVQGRFGKELAPHATEGDPHSYPSGVPDPVAPMSEQATRMASEAGVLGLPEGR
jgi:hypothetical protein